MMEQDFSIYDLVLKELRIVLEKGFEANDTLNAKAAVILKSASVIMLMMIATQALRLLRADVFSWGFIAVGLTLYFGLVLSAIAGMYPRDYFSPFPTDWDVIYADFLQQDPEEAQKKLISGYIEYIEQNDRTRAAVIVYIKCASWLMDGLALLLVIWGLRLMINSIL